MAINIKKRLLQRGVSTSWTDFYLNMVLEMAENVAYKKGTAIATNNGLFDFTNAPDEIKNIVDNYVFAQSLTEEYDKVIRGGGKTIIGGVSVQLGNTAAMQAVLTGILSSTKVNKSGDLLRDIGPAIQAYWLGAQLKRWPPPTVPCIGAVQNVSTILGINLNPGIWTPVVIPPVETPSPFLLNFILSAVLHLTTVGGFISCQCAYPPPAPPAPGVLPWVGYFVNPFGGNPITSFDWKDIASLAVGTLGNTLFDENGNPVASITDAAVNFTSQTFAGFIEGTGFNNEGGITSDQITKAIRSALTGENSSNLANTTNGQLPTNNNSNQRVGG